MKRGIKVHTTADDNKLTTSDRAFRMEQVRKGIYTGIARELRKAARRYHTLVDNCAGANWYRGGIIECHRCGFYFKFTAEDARELLETKS